MAIKQVILSDIGGQELTDETHARVIIEHPDNSFGIELDISVEEAERFQSSSLRLATVTIYAPDQPARTALVETKTLDRLFAGVDFDEVLAAGRRAGRPSRGPQGRTSAGSSAKSERLDYTAMENIGVIHRGRITEREAELVRQNMAQANQNREREGQPRVGEDPKDAQRYGLE